MLWTHKKSSSRRWVPLLFNAPPSFMHTVDYSTVNPPPVVVCPCSVPDRSWLSLLAPSLIVRVYPPQWYYRWSTQRNLVAGWMNGKKAGLVRLPAYCYLPHVVSLTRTVAFLSPPRLWFLFLPPISLALLPFSPLSPRLTPALLCPPLGVVHHANVQQTLRHITYLEAAGRI
jgi:hypothetical protein